MLRKKILKALIIAILATALPAAAIATELTLLNVSYDPTRELYYDGCEE